MKKRYIIGLLIGLVLAVGAVFILTNDFYVNFVYYLPASQKANIVVVSSLGLASIKADTIWRCRDLEDFFDEDYKVIILAPRTANLEGLGISDNGVVIFSKRMAPSAEIIRDVSYLGDRLLLEFDFDWETIGLFGLFIWGASFCVISFFIFCFSVVVRRLRSH